jgi:hypothetical protein
VNTFLKKNKYLPSSILLNLIFSISLLGQGLPLSISPENAQVYFITPVNETNLTSPVLIRFGLSNMGIAPAGSNIQNTGHHHLLIDLEELPSLDQSLPANENIRHFGLGQTEAYIDLSPGTHTLQLILGDWLHVPHELPVISEKITIHVE